MPTTTERLGLHRPSTSDPARVPHDLEVLTNQLDSQMMAVEMGTFASRPAAGKSKRQYWATDRKLLYLDTGSDWRQISTWVRSSQTSSWLGVSTTPGWSPADPIQYPRPTVLVPFAGKYRVTMFGGWGLSDTTTLGYLDVKDSLGATPEYPIVASAGSQQDSASAILTLADGACSLRAWLSKAQGDPPIVYNAGFHIEPISTY